MKKPPRYLTDFNKQLFRQRHQFSVMMRDWKPENFDATAQGEEDGNE